MYVNLESIILNVIIDFDNRIILEDVGIVIKFVFFFVIFKLIFMFYCMLY